MSLHVGHTDSSEWWVITHLGIAVAGPFHTKLLAEQEKQRLLLKEVS